MTSTLFKIVVSAPATPRAKPSGLSDHRIDRLSAVGENGEQLAFLDLDYCRVQDFLGHPIVRSNFDLSETELISLSPKTPMTIIGRLDDDLGGVRLMKAADRESDHVVRSLVEAALGQASGSGSTVVAINVPASQLQAFEAGALSTVRLHEHRWHSLLLNPSLSLEEQLGYWDAKTRRTWRKDFEVVENARLNIDVESVTPELLRELAALIANVRVRNGTSSHPVMVEYELNAWLAGIAGHAVAFVCRSSGGTVIGGTLANDDGSVLQIRDVGLVNDSDLRSLVYRGVVFAAPLRYAKSERLDEITLGYGHDLPKRSRGATSTVMSTVGYVSQDNDNATA